VIGVQPAGDFVALITERYRDGRRLLVPHLLRPEEARRVAGALLDAADAVEPPESPRSDETAESGP